MTTELWWAIGGVVALYVFVRWGLPALGWRRNCCGDCCATKNESPATATTDEEEAGGDGWSKTRRFTETTVQLPPKDR